MKEKYLECPGEKCEDFMSDNCDHNRESLVACQHLRVQLIRKAKYARNIRTGTYSPVDDEGVRFGIIYKELPEDGECVGEFVVDNIADLP